MRVLRSIKCALRRNYCNVEAFFARKSCKTQVLPDLNTLERVRGLQEKVARRLDVHKGREKVETGERKRTLAPLQASALSAELMMRLACILNCDSADHALHCAQGVVFSAVQLAIVQRALRQGEPERHSPPPSVLSPSKWWHWRNASTHWFSLYANTMSVLSWA